MSADERKPRKRSLLARIFCCIPREGHNNEASQRSENITNSNAVPANVTTANPPPLISQARTSSTSARGEIEKLEPIPAKLPISTTTIEPTIVEAPPVIPQEASPNIEDGTSDESEVQPPLGRDTQEETITAPGTTSIRSSPAESIAEEKAAIEVDEPLTPASASITVVDRNVIVPTQEVATEEESSGGDDKDDTHWLLPTLPPSLTGKKCLVLDLDETLVHSSFKVIQQADFVVPVEIDGIYHNVYVIKRPGVDDFMLEVGRHFEIVVFTASLAKYADPVLDILDIHKVVHHRLFRESCINHMGNYVKDLSQLGRDLKDAIIIDNSPASYIFHPAHAVPISSWFNDVHDTELTDLIPFLIDLTTVDDVSQVLELSI